MASCVVPRPHDLVQPLSRRRLGPGAIVYSWRLRLAQGFGGPFDSRRAILGKRLRRLELDQFRQSGASEFRARHVSSRRHPAINQFFGRAE